MIDERDLTNIRLEQETGKGSLGDWICKIKSAYNSWEIWGSGETREEAINNSIRGMQIRIKEGDKLSFQTKEPRVVSVRAIPGRKEDIDYPKTMCSNCDEIECASDGNFDTCKKLSQTY